MAFSITHHDHKDPIEGDMLLGGPYDWTTDTFTPEADSLLTIHFATFHVSTGPARGDSDETLAVSGGGLTWTKETGEAYVDGNWGSVTATFTAPVGSSPSSMDIDITMSGADSGTYWGGAWTVDDITGHDVSDPIVQSSIDAETKVGGGDSESHTFTFDSAPTSGNLVVALWITQGNDAGANSTPTGYSVNSSSTGPYLHHSVFYRDDTTDDEITVSDLGQQVNFVAVTGLEIEPESGGPQEETTSGTLNGGGEISPTVTHEASISGAVNGGGSISATVVHLEQASTSGVVNGGGSLSATVIHLEQASTSGTINGGGSLSATVVHTEHASTSSVVNGGGGLAVTFHKDVERAGAINAGGSITATASAEEEHTTSATLNGGGSLSSTVDTDRTGSGSVHAGGSVAAVVDHKGAVSASINSGGSISATVVVSEAGAAYGTINGGGSITPTWTAAHESSDQANSGGSISAIVSTEGPGATSGTINGGGSLAATVTTARRIYPYHDEQYAWLAHSGVGKTDFWFGQASWQGASSGVAMSTQWNHVPTKGIAGVDMWLWKVGAPTDDVLVEVRTGRDPAGGDYVTSGTINGADVSTEMTWTTILFDEPAVVDAHREYVISVVRDGGTVDSSNFYKTRRTQAYKLRWSFYSQGADDGEWTDFSENDDWIMGVRANVGMSSDGGNIYAAVEYRTASYVLNGGGSLSPAIEGAHGSSDTVSGGGSITSRSSQVGLGYVELELDDLIDPEVGTGHVLSVRGVASSGTQLVDISLYQGSTLVDSWADESYTTTIATHDLIVGTTEANTITDYTDLSVRIEMDSTATDVVHIAEVWLEVPPRPPASVSAAINSGGSIADARNHHGLVPAFPSLGEGLPGPIAFSCGGSITASVTQKIPGQAFGVVNGGGSISATVTTDRTTSGTLNTGPSIEVETFRERLIATSIHSGGRLRYSTDVRQVVATFHGGGSLHPVATPWHNIGDIEGYVGGTDDGTLVGITASSGTLGSSTSTGSAGNVIGSTSPGATDDGDGTGSTS